MFNPSRISRARLLLTALATALPVVSVADYGVLEGLIVGGPPALVLVLFTCTVKYRHLLLGLCVLAAAAFLMPILSNAYTPGSE